MENERMENSEMEQEQEIYVPRPTWQVWLARIGVVFVAAAFVMYLIHIATGGAI